MPSALSNGGGTTYSSFVPTSIIWARIVPCLSMTMRTTAIRCRLPEFGLRFEPGVEEWIWNDAIS